VSGHAELGASTAERWMNCSASVALSRDIPDSTSGYALEGTAAHALLYRCLTEKLPAGMFCGMADGGTGIEITEEMTEAVQQCVDAVEAILDLHPSAQMFLEKKFSLAALNPPAPMFGTADVVIYLPPGTLVVFDLKYGRGVYVTAQDNPQLLYYALGALLEVEREPSVRGKILQVRTIIMQPRMESAEGMVREACYDYDAVVGFATDLLAMARTALSPQAEMKTGSWCQFCRAAGVCPALKAQANAVAMVEFDDMPAVQPPPPTALTIAEIATVLEKADLVEDWLKAVRAYAMHALERGEVVPGWKLVPKRATRKWKSPSLVIDWLREHGVNEVEFHTAPELFSPAQTERVLKTLKMKLPDDLVEKVSSGNTLAPTNDPRPAVAAGPEHDFSDIPLLEAGEPVKPTESEIV
jgi:hypothetical protein